MTVTVKEKKPDIKEGYVPHPTKACYKAVAEKLPEEVTLNQLMDTLPKQVFDKSNTKAILAVLRTFIFTALGLYLVHISPWYLLPFAWIFAGTAGCGLFVLGHDCGHRSLFPSVFVNDLMGTFTLTLLCYPYHPWRIKHNFHHANTNKLYVDNAWQPTIPEMFVKHPLIVRGILRLIKGPFWFIGSIGHMFQEHFDVSAFDPKQQHQVKQSLYAVGIFAATLFPLLFKFAGIAGILKYYILPWMVFHFWMSTFTLVHHTLPHIPFLDEKEWKLVDSRFTATVHCNYPWWVEYLCHDINVHIPHHLTTSIPSYNLRLAHESLKQNWKKHMHEVDFSWELMYDIAVSCHMYHNQNYYQTFAHFWKSATD